MKIPFTRPLKLLLLIGLLAGPFAKAQDQLLLETKYYRFYSNADLNTHLFLYKHAVQVKTARLPDDSLRFYLTRENVPDINNSYTDLVAALKYYRDSLITKDLLFDSTMRKFSTMLVTKKATVLTGWHIQAARHLARLNPFFKKTIWPSIDSANRSWVKQVQQDLQLLEDPVLQRLQKLYGATLRKEKIRVDLGVYATWAGAYSYEQGFQHVIIASGEKNNQGSLGVEIVFHEGSHFLIDKIFSQLNEYEAARLPPNPRRGTWHILLFYTTGNVVKESYAARGIAFTPYYKVAKFEERIPPFKLTTDALALYWDPYMRGEGSQAEALSKIVDHLLAGARQ